MLFRSKLNLKFAKSAWDYVKYQVTLNPGETLDIEGGVEEKIGRASCRERV